MKKILLFIFFVIFSAALYAQKDTSDIAMHPIHVRDIPRDPGSVNVLIYPVPVKENYFTIKSDKEISYVKVTNIIGQDIYKIQYNNPLTIARINLENPKRGMYLVTVIFNNGVRVVKKILIEQTD